MPNDSNHIAARLRNSAPSAIPRCSSYFSPRLLLFLDCSLAEMLGGFALQKLIAKCSESYAM